MVNQDLGRVAVVARGAYDPSTEYERLDAVSYNGSSFLVRKHCLGVEPTEGEYYMLMAKAGDSTAANSAAVEALAAAGRADTAAGNADQQAAAAGVAAVSANEAAAEAKNVVDTVIPDVNKLKNDLIELEEENFNIKSMMDVYELGEISTQDNMYIVHPSGSSTNRARAKQSEIQKIPSGASSVTVKISEQSISNGKYKVGWAFYNSNYSQIENSVKGWFTTDSEFTQSVPNDAVYFMFYYASNHTSTVVVSELDNSKNSVIFNNDTTDYAKTLLKESKVEKLEKEIAEIKPSELLEKKIANINSNVLFINHRGFNTVAPENTIPAFELSKKEGFVYVETDVLFTSDNIPVLLHDGNINRTARNTDGTELSSDVAIGDITYAQALTYDFGIWRGDEYKGTKIPTFDEFMSLCKTRGLKPFIELKDEIVYTESMVNSIIAIVKKYGMIDNVWFISFSYDNLLTVKNTLPSAKLGLAAGWTATRNEESFMAVINQIKSLRTDTNTVAMSGGYQDFNDTFYNLCINNNVPLIMWTVDTKEAYNSLYPCFFAILSNCLSAYDVLI